MSIETEANQHNKILVFVTYCWDEGEQHHTLVQAFTNMLRQKGFDADMDRNKSQQRTSIDFSSMMNYSIQEARKVIVVLSKSYKRKAEEKSGGVGIEYPIILGDIDTHNTKYILVSFEPHFSDIVPFGLRNREVLDLTKKANLELLFARLLDKPLLNFAEVGTKKPEIEAKQIPSFESLIGAEETFSFNESRDKKAIADTQALQPIKKISEFFLDEYPNYHHWRCKLKLEDQSVYPEALADAYRRIVKRDLTAPNKLIRVLDDSLSRKVGLDAIRYDIDILSHIHKPPAQGRKSSRKVKLASIRSSHGLQITKSCIQHEIVTYYSGSYYNNLAEEMQGLIILLYLFESMAVAPMHLTLQMGIKTNNTAMLNTTNSLFRKDPSEKVYELFSPQFTLNKTITAVNDETIVSIIQELLRQFHTTNPSVEEPAYIRMDKPHFNHQLHELKSLMILQG